MKVNRVESKTGIIAVGILCISNILSKTFSVEVTHYAMYNYFLGICAGLALIGVVFSLLPESIYLKLKKFI